MSGNEEITVTITDGEVDAYIQSLHWHDTSEEAKNIAIMNIRGFHSMLKQKALLFADEIRNKICLCASDWKNPRCPVHGTEHGTPR